MLINPTFSMNACVMGLTLGLSLVLCTNACFAQSPTAQPITTQNNANEPPWIIGRWARAYPGMHIQSACIDNTLEITRQRFIWRFEADGERLKQASRVASMEVNGQLVKIKTVQTMGFEHWKQKDGRLHFHQVSTNRMTILQTTKTHDYESWIRCDNTAQGQLDVPLSPTPEHVKNLKGTWVLTTRASDPKACESPNLSVGNVWVELNLPLTHNKPRIVRIDAIKPNPEAGTLLDSKQEEIHFQAQPSDVLQQFKDAEGYLSFRRSDSNLLSLLNSSTQQTVQQFQRCEQVEPSSETSASSGVPANSWLIGPWVPLRDKEDRVLACQKTRLDIQSDRLTEQHSPPGVPMIQATAKVVSVQNKGPQIEIQLDNPSVLIRDRQPNNRLVFERLGVNRMTIKSTQEGRAYLYARCDHST